MLAINRMTEIKRSRISDLLNAQEGNTDSESKARILTQKEVDEKIRN